MNQRRRRARPTIRCLTEDLAIPLPSLDVDLGDIDHPVMNEARRLAATSPRGQKRIESIEHPMVYRLRHSTWRGATWVDEDHDVLWVLAGGSRAGG